MLVALAKPPGSNPAGAAAESDRKVVRPVVAFEFGLRKMPEVKPACKG